MNRILALSLTLLLVAVQSATGQDTAPASTQESPIRDSKALAVLTQALQVAGAGNAQDASGFAASGSITYYWAGEEVKGSVLISAKGAAEFSLQVSLPESSRSMAVSHGTGAIQEIDGTTAKIPYYNAVNQAALTLPLLRVLAAVSNLSTEVSYLGLEATEGQTAHHIRLVVPADQVPDPEDHFKNLRTLEVFIDSATLLIAKTGDAIHADRDMTDQYPRELFFSDYRAVSGVLVPFAVTETFGGQRTWSLQLDSASFTTTIASAGLDF
jgi:hypothetical protein